MPLRNIALINYPNRAYPSLFCIPHSALTISYRLIAVRSPSLALSGGEGLAVQFAYNGLGDRRAQNMNGKTTTYTLDLPSGLTQVLDDGAYTCTYGSGRISQSQIQICSSNTAYFLSDALGAGICYNGNITNAGFLTRRSAEVPPPQAQQPQSWFLNLVVHERNS